MIRPDHYSYAVYADPATAESFDAQRFSGPIGSLVAETQARILGAFLGDAAGRSVLDVGTGTGRAALALARLGARVTAIDASLAMLSVAARRAAALGVRVALARGDAHRLAFADRSFDAAVSLRVLMHTPDWRRCLGELCRVARDRVVFDYPALLSVATAQSTARRLGRLLGLGTEPYRVLSHRAVRGALRSCGFEVAGLHRQFVLPIALHKALGSRRLTERTERMLAVVGLLAIAGSPVTVVARRCTSS